MITSRKGFTLVELIVATFITGVVVLAATGPFVDIMRYQQEAENIDELNDNIQAILTILDKELRTASDTASGVNAVSFQNQAEETIQYQLRNGALIKIVGGVETAITTTEVMNINEFDVTVTPSSDTSPALVTVSIQANSVDNFNSIRVQTSVIARNS